MQWGRDYARDAGRLAASLSDEADGGPPGTNGHPGGAGRSGGQSFQLGGYDVCTAPFARHHVCSSGGVAAGIQRPVERSRHPNGPRPDLPVRLLRQCDDPVYARTGDHPGVWRVSPSECHHGLDHRRPEEDQKQH